MCVRMYPSDLETSGVLVPETTLSSLSSSLSSPLSTSGLSLPYEEYLRYDPGHNSPVKRVVGVSDSDTVVVFIIERPDSWFCP